MTQNASACGHGLLIRQPAADIRSDVSFFDLTTCVFDDKLTVPLFSPAKMTVRCQIIIRRYRDKR